MNDRPTIEDLRSLVRLWYAVKSLQKLMHRRIDPEGTMTPRQFEDLVLAEIDHEDLNAAVMQVEAFLERATDDEDEPKRPALH